MKISKTIQQYPVLAFIVLTLGLSFSVFLIPVPPENAFAMIAFLVLPIPTLVAFVLVRMMDGRTGAGAFFRQCFRWRASWKWYLIAFATGFVIHIGSSVVALLAGRISAIEISTPNGFFIAVFLFAVLEEIGWRGFALHRLLNRHSPFAATLIVAIPWALLHFVLFLLFVPDVSTTAETLVVFGFAFPLTWIYVKSSRNVLVATVMHGGLNAFAIAGAAIAPEDVLWFVAISSFIVGIVLLIMDRRMWFTHTPEHAANETAAPAA